MKRTFFFLLTMCLFSSCTIMYRAVRFGTQDIDDYNVFPTYELTENQDKFRFEEKEDNLLDTLDIDWEYKNVVYHNLDSLLEASSTRSFLVIRNDSVIYENYFQGYERDDISTVFSVSKSITSLLVGIAVDDGYITDINDPVTKYIPELRSADPMFKELTIKHLLDMRSGLKFNESYAFNPFAKIARLYYGRNQMALIKKLHFECEPGTKYEYQSISTAILGIVIEKATQQNFAEYFEKKVWKPLEMENTAKWSLDDKKHQSVKAYGGLSISAIDLAKIGRLYLNGGKYKGKQIVSKEWVNTTLTPNVDNEGYQYQWYSLSGGGRDSTGTSYFNDSITAQELWCEKYSKDYAYYEIIKIEKEDYSKRARKKYWKFDSDFKWRLKLYTNQYYALGIMKQILFVDPEKNTIIVRLGDHSDFDKYTALMYTINTAL